LNSSSLLLSRNSSSSPDICEVEATDSSSPQEKSCSSGVKLSSFTGNYCLCGSGTNCDGFGTKFGGSGTNSTSSGTNFIGSRTIPDCSKDDWCTFK
ncbi:hypothetical protein KI387_022341, partial [Taxus chinensis]